MQISCLQQDLISAIQTVQKALSSKGTSPIYQYIYMETIEDGIKLIATNQSQTIITQIDASIKTEGKILLPGSLLRDIISKMPSVMIDLISNERNLMTVSYINMKYTIQGTPTEGFSFMDTIESETEFEIKTKTLKEIVLKTYFTASIEESRPTLNGMYFNCRAGQLDVVTSDSYRLSLAKEMLDESLNFNILIPAKILSDIMHIADDGDEMSHMSFNNRYIKIKTGKTMLITGLISGSFINYESIIPKEYKTKMTCARSVLLSILERAFILSDKTSLYLVKFEISYSKLFVSSNSDAGEAYEEIQVQTDGDPLVIAFNSKYFIEILRNIEYEVLTFEFTTSTRTCVIRPVESDDILYLIVPVRL